jgi:hypothetical protein
MTKRDICMRCVDDYMRDRYSSLENPSTSNVKAFITERVSHGYCLFSLDNKSAHCNYSAELAVLQENE